MDAVERREHRRGDLQLPILRLQGAVELSQGERVRTDNVSSGGMYFRVPSRFLSLGETAISFELYIPPGGGYTVSPGTVRGTGRIVRIDSPGSDTVGIAVRFTGSLALLS